MTNQTATEEGNVPEEYNLELDKVAERIRAERAKMVCVQLPDGLKPRAAEVVDILESKTGATVVVWLGSCYGACDVPLNVKEIGVDLLVQWGHSEWI